MLHWPIYSWQERTCFLIRHAWKSNPQLLNVPIFRLDSFSQINWGAAHFNPSVSSIPHALPAPGTIVHIYLRLLPTDIARVFLDVISIPEELAITSLGTAVIVSKINYPIYFKWNLQNVHSHSNFTWYERKRVREWEGGGVRVSLEKWGRL